MKKPTIPVVNIVGDAYTVDQMDAHHAAWEAYAAQLKAERDALRVSTERLREAVAGLVEKWEQEAGRIGLSKWADGYITAMKRCLGELKAALSAKGENEDTTHER